jgi:hypothetical protein
LPEIIGDAAMSTNQVRDLLQLQIEDKLRRDEDEKKKAGRAKVGNVESFGEYWPTILERALEGEVIRIPAEGTISKDDVMRLRVSFYNLKRALRATHLRELNSRYDDVSCFKSDGFLTIKRGGSNDHILAGLGLEKTKWEDLGIDGKKEPAALSPDAYQEKFGPGAHQSRQDDLIAKMLNLNPVPADKGEDNG